MNGKRIDGQYVREWLNSHDRSVPLAELVEDWSDERLVKWFMSLYDRPGSGMSSLYISSIDMEKMK